MTDRLKGRILNMSEKFLNLPRVIQSLIVALVWFLTIAGFVGCLLVKEYAANDMYWLEILLTCVGMFFSVVGICLTIVYLTLKKDEQN